MRYYIRNFTKIKQVISTNVLGEVATRYMADHYTKKFFFEKHLDFLLIFQLTCKESLSDAVQFVKDNKRVKDFLPEIIVSQVSRANINRDYAIAEIFYYLVDRALSSKKLNLSNEEKEYIKNIKILDSTLIRLCLKYFDWAEYRKNVGAIKIHMLMDLESLCSEKIFMTSGKPHDSQLMNAIGFEPNHTYLFNRGYINYKVFDSMCDNDIYFIKRLKKNAAMTILEEYKLPKGDHNSMSDCKVITGQENGNTKMTNPLRLIIAASDEKNIYVFLPIGLI